MIPPHLALPYVWLMIANPCFGVIVDVGVPASSLMISWGSSALNSEPPSPPDDLQLSELLHQLQQRGLNFIFSSRLVTQDMRVKRLPRGLSDRDMLDHALAQHDLCVKEDPAGHLLVVKAELVPTVVKGRVLSRRDGASLAGVRIQVADRQVVSDQSGRFVLELQGNGRSRITALLDGFFAQQVIVPHTHKPAELELVLDALPVFIEEIVVTPSTVTLLDQGMAQAPLLTSEEIDVLPRIADDLYRALSRLPGTAGGDISAKFHVRGGTADEVSVYMDSQEIYEPYHLKDLLSVFSVFDSKAIGHVNFSAGGYTSKYGNAMSGIIELSSIEPHDALSAEAGSSFFNKRLLASDRFSEGRGSWFVSVREGFLDLLRAASSPTGLVRLDGEEETFRFNDAQGKFQFHFNDRFTATLNALSIIDLIEFSDRPYQFNKYDIQDAHFAYNDLYVWTQLDFSINDQLRVKTLLSNADLMRDRRGHQEREDGALFDVDDQRDFSVQEIKQNWSMTLAEDHFLQWGFGIKQVKASYDYESRLFATSPLVIGAGDPVTHETFVNEAFSGHQRHAYLSYRVRPVPRLTVELGGRWDSQTYLESSPHQWSPRGHLKIQVANQTALRASWGRYHQAPRFDQLQVEDGIRAFGEPQHAEHRVLGFEHRFINGIELRLDAYHKDYGDLAPRFENGLNPVALFPESEPDRWRIDAQSARSQGLEFYVKGHASRWSLDWWIGSTYARVYDLIQGSRVARGWDQRHATTFGINSAIGTRWNINFAGEYHSGWPTTAVSARAVQDDSGELKPLPSLGPQNGDHFPDFKRLDMRISHATVLPRGKLSFFLEIANLLNEDNPCCVEYQFSVDPEGNAEVDADIDHWMPLLPSFGVTYRY